jgi:hypothetical protein
VPGDGRGREGAVKIYRGMTFLLAATTMVLGLAMLVIGLSRGATAGMLLGTLFTVAGAGRLYVLRGRR